MGVYPEKIIELIARPRYAGACCDGEASGVAASVECGASVKIALKIDVETGAVVECKYLTSGCGFAAAACEISAKAMASMRVAEIGGSPEAVVLAAAEVEIGAEIAARSHCVSLVADAVKAAFAAHRWAVSSEYAGSEALICTCFGVTENDLEKCIAENGLTTVSSVADRCRAGGGCGSCRPLIEEIIDNFNSSGAA